MVKKIWLTPENNFVKWEACPFCLSDPHPDFETVICQKPQCFFLCFAVNPLPQVSAWMIQILYRAQECPVSQSWPCCPPAIPLAGACESKSSPCPQRGRLCSWAVRNTSLIQQSRKQPIINPQPFVLSINTSHYSWSKTIAELFVESFFYLLHCGSCHFFSFSKSDFWSPFITWPAKDWGDPGGAGTMCFPTAPLLTNYQPWLNANTWWISQIHMRYMLSQRLEKFTPRNITTFS